MLTYDLKVGYTCNNKCKHCVIDDSKDQLIDQKKNIDLTTNECFEQIDEVAKRGIRNIVLTGGEVTIRKDFPDLIEKCKKYGLSITVQTNGRKLSSEKIINSIRDVKDIRFVIALHGDTESVHDEVTQIRGSFRQTCESIRTICGMGKLVILKIVISKINMESLPKIVELAKDLGVQYICFAFPHGHGAARKNFDTVIPRYSQLKPFLDSVILKAKELCINIEFEAIPFCIIPHALHYVGELKYYDGDTLCTQVREETFQWNEVRISIKSKGKKCQECDMNMFCEGVWCEYAEAFGVDELIPIVFPVEKKEKIITQIKQWLKNR